ncbi:MAG: hypothetical protein ABI383_03770 [Acidobacteriaceae bacterium]
MEIHFTPDVERSLNQIASQTGRGTDEFVQESVKSHIDHEEWFRREVEKGLASLDRGD